VCDGAGGVKIVIERFADGLSRRLDGIQERRVLRAGRHALLRERIESGMELAEPLEAGRGGADRLFRVVAGRAIMGRENEDPEGFGAVSLEQVCTGAEVAKRLAHLHAIDRDHVVMNPVARERLVGDGLTLRDLALVVRKHVLETAAVDVERLAQILGAHDRALDMPAGISGTPGRVPLEDVVGLCALPEREVLRIALVGTSLDAHRFAQFVDRAARKLAVVFERSDVEIHVPVGNVRMAFLNKLLNGLDLLADMLGRAHVEARVRNAQSFHVMHILEHALVNDLVGVNAVDARLALDLVLAGVGVIGQMANVGDILHITHIEPALPEMLHKHIERYIALCMAKMRRPVDSRPADIDANMPLHQRDELLFRATHRVVQH